MSTGRVQVTNATERGFVNFANSVSAQTKKVTGNNISRLWGHIENAAIHVTNGVLKTVIEGVGGNATLLAENAYYGIVGIKNWALTDPAKITTGVTAADKAANTHYTKTSALTTTQGDQAVQKIIDEPTAKDNYKWNLPPHVWSLPVAPSSMDSNIIDGQSEDTMFHSRRRGRIFYGFGYVGNTLVKDPKSKTGWSSKPSTTQDNHNGFQFIWNPETFSQTTAVNMNVTPSSTDVLSGITTYVDANSSISFTLRLDRTNDFACARAYNVIADVPKNSKGEATLGVVTRTYDNVSNLTNFYSIGQAENSDNDFSTNIESKIKDLLKYGTESDLDWLYKTINGPGFVNIGGRPSANIGYLRPTLIRLDLGPQKFVGVVSEIDVNHLTFTSDYIPIRTDVTITISLRANANMANSNATGGTSNGAPRSTP